jgi:hypothetical protein
MAQEIEHVYLRIHGLNLHVAQLGKGLAVVMPLDLFFHILSNTCISWSKVSLFRILL